VFGCEVFLRGNTAVLLFTTCSNEGIRFCFKCTGWPVFVAQSYCTCVQNVTHQRKVSEVGRFVFDVVCGFMWFPFDKTGYNSFL